MTNHMVRRINRDMMSPTIVMLKSLPGFALMIFAVLYFLWDGWGVNPPSIVLTIEGLVAIGIWILGWLILPTPRPNSHYERIIQALGRNQISWTMW